MIWSRHGSAARLPNLLRFILQFFSNPRSVPSFHVVSLSGQILIIAVEILGFVPFGSANSQVGAQVTDLSRDYTWSDVWSEFTRSWPIQRSRPCLTLIFFGLFLYFQFCFENWASEIGFCDLWTFQHQFDKIVPDYSSDFFVCCTIDILGLRSSEFLIWNA